jgi:hypothetical protein
MRSASPPAAGLKSARPPLRVQAFTFGCRTDFGAVSEGPESSSQKAIDHLNQGITDFFKIFDMNMIAVVARDVVLDAQRRQLDAPGFLDLEDHVAKIVVKDRLVFVLL